MRGGEYWRQCFSTQIVDVERGQVLDVVPGRSGAAPSAWLTAQGEEWLAHVAYATPQRASGVQTREMVASASASSPRRVRVLVRPSTLRFADPACSGTGQGAEYVRNPHQGASSRGRTSGVRQRRGRTGGPGRSLIERRN